MKYENLYDQYNQDLPVYEAFCDYFEQECRCLLSETNIQYYELSFRIKTWESILEKIERKKLIVDSLDKIHDIIGFRIITLFKQDIDIVCDIIEQEFKVLHFDNKAQAKAEDVFGYLSVHYEISLKEKWLGAPSTDKFQNIKTEIQIRTFSQHVWAASSHLLQYKIESTVPAAMRRNIYRLAAVLEIVDNELENIRSSHDTYQLEMKERLQVDNAMFSEDALLDSIMLEGILDLYFPHENKRVHEPYDSMLSELFESSIMTSGQLKTLLDKKLPYVKEKEARRNREYQRPFYSYMGLLRIALSRTDK